MRANRSSRNIHLSGHRRISSSLAIGFVFSAVSGFVIDAEQRDGEIWATNDYSNVNTPDYQINKELNEFPGGDELILTIGLTRDSIADEVSMHLHKQDLNNFPKLHLYSDAPITSAAQANLVVNKLKKELKSVLVKTKVTKVHLFYAGPGYLALLLGHRWNGLPILQCYEWVNTGQYVPTCTIRGY
ncbi:SAVED domain-containing protein [Virgibacillus oceani]|uniref:SAVED domain-containing protein n=1 Tax=Virgibacillus oceani TaxID=1479511 RepID=UPI001E4BD31B|nr:SAVED domain-containing protein [Virgibacillus oceani]